MVAIIVIGAVCYFFVGGVAASALRGNYWWPVWLAWTTVFLWPVVIPLALLVGIVWAQFVNKEGH